MFTDGFSSSNVTKNRDLHFVTVLWAAKILCFDVIVLLIFDSIRISQR
jgi:hypothetical protein